MTTTQLLLDTKMIINSDFFNQSPLSVFIWSNDEEWTIQDVSKNITNLLGYTKDDKIIFYSSLIHSADILRVKEEVSSNSSSNKSNFKHDPYRIKKKMEIIFGLKIQHQLFMKMMKLLIMLVIFKIAQKNKNLFKS